MVVAFIAAFSVPMRDFGAPCIMREEARNYNIFTEVQSKSMLLSGASFAIRSVEPKRLYP